MPIQPTTLTAAERKELTDFVNRLYWIFGGASFTWTTVAAIAVSRITAVELPFWGQASVTEVVLTSLVVLPLLSVPALMACFVHRRHLMSTAVSRFPGVPAGVMNIPKMFTWLRPFLFFFLIVVPMCFTFYCWHRMTYRYTIVWKPAADGAMQKYVDAWQEALKQPPPATKEKLQEIKLGKLKESEELAGWRKYNPFGLPASVLHADWRWRGQYIEWTKKEEHAGFDEHGNPVFKGKGYTRVQPTGFPFIMPVAGLLLMLGHVGAVVGVLWRR